MNHNTICGCGFELEPDVSGVVGFEGGELHRGVRHVECHGVVKQVCKGMGDGVNNIHNSTIGYHKATPSKRHLKGVSLLKATSTTLGLITTKLNPPKPFTLHLPPS